MDSALEVSQPNSSKTILPTLRSKGAKPDSDYGRPPTRASSKEFILKRRSENVQDDKLLQISYPKRKRSGHETRSWNLNDLVDPPDLNVTSSECFSEGPTTTIFHDCPIEPESEMRCMESEAEVSHLAEPGDEDVAKDSFENPSFEKGNPKSLSASAVFQQKLFGSGFGCFVASHTDSSAVTPTPILSDTMIENEDPVSTSPVGTKVITSIPPIPVRS